MDDLTRRMEENRDALVPDWDEVRAARVRVRIDAAGRERRRTRAAVGVLAVAAAAVLAIASHDWSPSADNGGGVALVSPAPVPAGGGTGGAAPAAVELADGSRAVALTSDTQVTLVERGEDRVALELRRGVARFEVTPDRSRHFEVQAGPVRVEVVGTIFEVARGERDVRVSVERGAVRVHLGDEVVELGAGDAHTFDTQVPADVEPEAAHAEKEAPPPPARPVSWRALVARGKFGKAYEQLESLGSDEAPATADALMDAADAARFSGHARAAIPYLERVAREHARDPRAPLAAFTMGRLLLDELGQPRKAAMSFARSQELAPGGDLAEDALAREVEAWSKAGEVARAHERAAAYVDRFPRGRRLGSVKKFGEIE